MVDADDTLDTTGLDEETARAILATHDGTMTSADLREAFTLALTTGWRPRYARCGTAMTPQQREAPTMPPPNAAAVLAERRAALAAERHGGDVVTDVDWEDGNGE